MILFLKKLNNYEPGNLADECSFTVTQLMSAP